MIKQDLVAFLAQRRGVPEAIVSRQYATVKKQHAFGSRAYKELMIRIHELFAPIYGENSEKELIATHRFHAALHIYRHISYVQREGQKYERWARRIAATVDGPMTVVDYGAGLGHLSAALAQIRPRTKVYLLDIDSMILDFAAFRFKRLGIDFDVIRVTETCVYPVLPRHNVCIAIEVFEHLVQPLVALENIRQAMDRGGILVHSGGNRARYFLHVSPNLEALHAEMQRDFVRIGPRLYRKVA